MKQHIDVFDYAGHICKAMKKGVLLTTASGETVNTMTIGWGMIGIEWNRPVFIAYVRETRYTKQLLEGNGEFTVNVPFGDYDSDILRFCGTKSGRDVDKISKMGLSLVESEHISVPGIKEFPLTLECKVIYSQKQNVHTLPKTITDRFYPVMDDQGFRDYHIAYYGEILDAYILNENGI